MIDAQIQTSALLGRYTADHPSVKQSQMAETEIARDLATELNVAIRGIDVDLGLTESRVDNLQAQLNDVRKRLETLATVRASYGNLVQDIKQRSDILKAARENLADARGNRLSTDVTSQISLINEPDTGSRPVDPDALAIIVAGIAGGLAIGIGIVFLTVHPSAPAVPAIWQRKPLAPSRDNEVAMAPSAGVITSASATTSASAITSTDAKTSARAKTSTDKTTLTGAITSNDEQTSAGAKTSTSAKTSADDKASASAKKSTDAKTSARARTSNDEKTSAGAILPTDAKTSTGATTDVSTNSPLVSS